MNLQTVYQIQYLKQTFYSLFIENKKRTVQFKFAYLIIITYE